MNPDLFITIVFAGLAGLVGLVGVLLVAHEHRAASSAAMDKEAAAERGGGAP